MKRKNNLYKDIYNIDNIIKVTNEVCRNTKNKRKVNKFKEYKCIYVSKIYNELKNKEYKVGPYNVFTIYEPKERRIVSQSVYDKIVNHLVARYILMPALLPCLINTNVASRKGLGTSAGYKYFKDFSRICKINYKEYYILKCDIKKFFASIDKEILKNKIRKRIKDKDALEIVYDIIDSEKTGIGIGNMTSQIFAIYYLNDLDHYIKEKLKIKYYVRYQDDFLLFHISKEYLKECFIKITEFMKTENLELNSKSRLYRNSNNFIFLGKDSKGRIYKKKKIRKHINKKYYMYKTNQIKLNSLVSTINCSK